MNRDPTDVVAADLHLPRMDPNSHGEVESADGLAECERATDRLRRALEGRQDPVACGLHESAAKALDLAARKRLMAVQELAPPFIAHVASTRGRIDDVGEHEGLESAKRVTFPSHSCEELLDLLYDGGGVRLPDVVVSAEELDEFRTQDLAGDVAGALDRRYVSSVRWRTSVGVGSWAADSQMLSSAVAFIRLFTSVGLAESCWP